MYDQNEPFYEPSADARFGANATFDLYRAYVGAGFTEEQSLTLLIATVSAIAAAQVQQKPDDTF